MNKSTTQMLIRDHENDELVQDINEKNQTQHSFAIPDH